MPATPNSAFLIAQGFACFSDPMRDPIAFTDSAGQPIRTLSHDERVLARVIGVALKVEEGQPNSERMYVLVNSNGLAMTGAYDHGTFWLKRFFTDMSVYGYRMLRPMGLTDEK